MTMQTNSKIWQGVAILWFMMSIYGLFLQAPSTQPPPFIHMDKVAHWGLFLVQFYVLGRVIYAKTYAIPYGKLLLLALFWAISSELIQGYFTARHMDIYDMMADMTGAICALVLLRPVSKT